MPKKILSERQVRRFQKLAEISSLDEMGAEVDDLDEGGAAARVGNEDRDVGRDRMTADRIREGDAKPDFPDVDGDGDTEEPISKASKEKKGKGDKKKGDKDMSKVPPQLRKHVAKKKKGAVDENNSAALDESQMRELIGRIKNRIVQENRKVNHMTRATQREQQIRLVEAQVIQNIETNRAVQQREAITEALVARVVNRLKDLNK